LQAEHVAVLLHRHVRQGDDSVPDVSFDERPAGQQHVGSFGVPGELMATDHQADFPQCSAGHRAVRQHLIACARQQLLDGAQPAAQQDVYMPTLRNSLADPPR
jgi:hypothetical protein